MTETARKRVTGTFVGAFWGLLIILLQLHAFNGVLKGSFAGYMLISFLQELSFIRLWF